MTRKYPNTFVRNFKFPWYDVLLFLIFRHKECINSELSSFYSQTGLSDLRISRQATFKALKKVNPNVFVELIHQFSQRFYQTSLVKDHMGYILLSEDGTTLNLLKTKESIKQFGFCVNQKIKDEKSAQRATSRSAALYDVTNGLIIDFKMKKYTDSEIPIAVEQLEYISYLNGHKAIYLADRNYDSVELFSLLEDKGLKYVIRGKANFFKEYVSAMKSDDEWITVEIHRTWQRRLKYEQPRLHFKGNPFIKIRVVKQRYTYYRKNQKFEDRSRMGKIFFKRLRLRKMCNSFKGDLP